jgi:diguanylate cyclase (GGDEF)-like protein
VTGLPNRLRLEEEVEAAIGSCGPSCVSALLCLDLDDYKTVNDSLGHAAGDHVLREVARRLEAAVGDGPSLARLTGDSFLVFLTGPGAGAAEAVARQVLGAFSRPFEVDGVEFQLGATVGVSVAHCGGIGFGEHLRRSEAAMYRAKRSAPGTHARYEPEADDPRARLTMTARLRRALDRGELTLHYQPIYTLPARVPSALEALLRWEDPVTGTVSPAEFIPAAEASGLIGEIGAWVADAACRQLAEWTRMGFGVAVGFNVSPVQLQSERFVDILRATIERHDIDPGLLIAEITESVAMEDVARTTSVLRSLADTGVGLVIDDFGAGHSSLTRLRGLPVSSMKIDRALMHGIDTDPGAAAVVRATLALAQALGIRTVAEGVETEAQLGVLVGAGCAYAQGFLLARPMPAEAATRLLADALAPTSAS